MPLWIVDPQTGEIDDRVNLELAGASVRICESYTVHVSVFDQPALFQLTVSARDGTAEILKSYPARSPFTLKIGDVAQFTGELGRRTAHGASGSTSVHFSGRDLLARLYDEDVDAERSFTNATYRSLVEDAKAACGLQDKIVLVGNAAARDARAGVKIVSSSEAVTDDEVQVSPSSGGLRHKITAKLGESWLAFLHRHLKKRGLFLWTGPTGHLFLSRPNPKQDPTFHFVRQRGQSLNVCNIEDAFFDEDTDKRFSEVVIYARNSGRKFGRNHKHAGFVDAEMERLGFARKRTYRDVNVTSEEEAQFYAAWKIAEACRAGWHLTYTFKGHTGPTLNGQRAVLAPDMMALVDDDELGIHGPLYISDVEHVLGASQVSRVTMMRPEHLVFGADD